MTVKGTDRPSEKTCNTEGCNAWATKQSGRTRCDNCGGKSTGPKTAEGKDTVSRNGITHGVTADPLNLYKALDSDAKAWVDGLAEGYYDILGYDENDPRRERVTRACIHIYQANSGEGQILEGGLSEEQTIGVSDDGRPIVKDEGHHLNQLVLKRDKEARQILRTLGAFDDPESQKADAMSDMDFEINIQRVTEDNVNDFGD